MPAQRVRHPCDARVAKPRRREVDRVGVGKIRHAPVDAKAAVVEPRDRDQNIERYRLAGEVRLDRFVGLPNRYGFGFVVMRAIEAHHIENRLEQRLGACNVVEREHERKTDDPRRHAAVLHMELSLYLSVSLVANN